MLLHVSCSRNFVSCILPRYVTSRYTRYVIFTYLTTEVWFIIRVRFAGVDLCSTCCFFLFRGVYCSKLMLYWWLEDRDYHVVEIYAVCRILTLVWRTYWKMGMQFVTGLCIYYVGPVGAVGAVKSQQRRSPAARRRRPPALITGRLRRRSIY